MNQREQVVEEARSALLAFDEYWGDGGPVDAAYGRPFELIRKLLSVFEEANTATNNGKQNEAKRLAIAPDDERCAQCGFYACDCPDVELEDGSRRILKAATAEANGRYRSRLIEDYDGDRYVEDEYGYDATARQAFVAGALWQAGIPAGKDGAR